MKSSGIVLLLIGMLLLNTNTNAAEPLVETERPVTVITVASSFLRLYSQHDGRPGYPMENWYLKNTSRNEAIKVTVLFWNGNYALSDKWTRTFTLEPGEIKSIGNKYGYGRVTTYCRIEGARYI